MNRQLHFWFDHARFAIRPLGRSEDGKEIRVQWHWLKRSLLLPESRGVLAEFSSHARLTEPGWGVPELAHRSSGARIQTGQVFAVRALDHLPDLELLDLQ
jgi:hypothetical protein